MFTVELTTPNYKINSCQTKTGSGLCGLHIAAHSEVGTGQKKHVSGPSAFTLVFRAVDTPQAGLVATKTMDPMHPRVRTRYEHVRTLPSVAQRSCTDRRGMVLCKLVISALNFGRGSPMFAWNSMCIIQPLDVLRDS